MRVRAASAPLRARAVYVWRDDDVAVRRDMVVPRFVEPDSAGKRTRGARAALVRSTTGPETLLGGAVVRERPAYVVRPFDVRVVAVVRFGDVARDREPAYVRCGAVVVVTRPDELRPLRTYVVVPRELPERTLVVPW